MTSKTKLILSNKQAPGDALMLSAAIRDLHLSYPEEYLTDVRSPIPEIWLYNPYITRIYDSDKEAKLINMEYPLYKTAKENYVKCCYHFAHAFRKFLEEKIGRPIKQTILSGDLYLSPLEKTFPSNLVKTSDYWLINTGGKKDFTNKIWEFERFRAVVKAFPNTHFVQVGALRHLHKALEEPNVTCLLGRTNIRDLIRLTKFSAGIITPVSFLMHLSVAVPANTGNLRPCIVLAGGRENSLWERYPGHVYISREGMLPCCLSKPCWLSRVIPLYDGEPNDGSICENPVETSSKQVIPKCMDLISADEVIYSMKLFGVK